MNALRNNSKQASRRRKSTPSFARTTRRGFASGLMLMMLVFLAGFIALGLNVSRLSQVQAQLRGACQAAALAGAAELLDEGFLAGAADQRDDIAAARETARLTALVNFVDGRPVDLNPNTKNAPLGDIVVGSIEPLMWSGQPLALPVDITQAQGLNTVRVTARLQLNTYNKVTMFMGSLLGVLSKDSVSSAQATLDRRVAGFRPEPGVKVPVVPMVAEFDSWMKQATAPCKPGFNDLYTMNYRTGEVTPGADGIPEIALSTAAVHADTEGSSSDADDTQTTDTADDTNAAAGSTDQPTASSPPPAWCRALVLSSDVAVANVWSVRCREGLSIADLAQFGGQLIVLPQGATLAQTLTALPTELPYGLMDIVGSSRAWALAEAGADENSCEIVGFAAGRIVAVRRSSTTSKDSSSGDWEIVVQPTTLVSSQAVTTVNMSPNPWIGKLELTQ